MNFRNVSLNTNSFALVIPLLLISLCIFIVKFSFLELNSFITGAITFDLLITIPFVYYLLIRKTQIYNASTLSLVFIGYFIGISILPESKQFYFVYFKQWIFPILKIIAFIFILAKIKKGIENYKSNEQSLYNLHTTIKQFYKVFFSKRIASLLTLETLVFYYGAIRWNRKPLKNNEYTYYKNTPAQSILIGFIIVLAVVTYVMHIFFIQWNKTIAWIVVIFSGYTTFQIIGFTKSLAYIPFCINKDHILLNYGFMIKAQISLSNIKNITAYSGKIKKNEELKSLSPLGVIEGYNLILDLKEEIEIKRMYGKSKTCSKIALFLDEKEAFKIDLEQALQKCRLEKNQT